MTAKDDAGKAMGPVEKQQWLDDAAALAHLSRAELAALIVIANTMNSKTGIAWLSMATIGRRTGTTTRTANNITKRLLGLGLVELVKRGTRQGASNHYTLNRHYFSQPAGSEAGDTTPGEVVKPSVEGSEAQRTEVVKQASPISIPESEPLAKDEGDRSQAEAGTAPLRPAGACVASRQTKRGADQFPEFWQVWPKRTDVAATEQAIAEALAEGVPLAEIIAGTERFARYCEATGTPPKSKPSTFVRGDRWRDAWELTRRTPASKPAKATTTAKAAKDTGKAKAKQAAKPQASAAPARKVKPSRPPIDKGPWVINPAYKEWDICRQPIEREHGPTGRRYNSAIYESWYEKNPKPPAWLNSLTGELCNKGPFRDHAPT